MKKKLLILLTISAILFLGTGIKAGIIENYSNPESEYNPDTLTEEPRVVPKAVNVRNETETEARSIPTRSGCPTEGLVPCGTPGCPCTLCDFFVMFRRIIDFVLFQIVPPLAGLIIAIGGFLLISAYTGITEGGPQSLNRAKALFKAVVIGLFIIYGAWIIINTFFMVIGVAEWTGLKEGWWKIECESSVPSRTTPSPQTPSSPGEPSPRAPSGPEEITVRVRDELGTGWLTTDEIYVYVDITNNSKEPKIYAVNMYDEQGRLVTDETTAFRKIDPGKTGTLRVTTAGNSNWDINDLGGQYKITISEKKISEESFKPIKTITRPVLQPNK